MTQTRAILAYLRDGHSLTAIEALERFGCFRLAARISDARLLLEEGESIVTEMVSSNGKTYARYGLQRKRVEAYETVALW